MVIKLKKFNFGKILKHTIFDPLLTKINRFKDIIFKEVNIKRV